MLRCTFKAYFVAHGVARWRLRRLLRMPHDRSTQKRPSDVSTVRAITKMRGPPNTPKVSTTRCSTKPDILGIDVA